MIIGSRRIILIGAIAAVAITIILVPVLFTINAPDWDKISVRLEKVNVRSMEAQSIQTDVVFGIVNPTDQTVTTSRIEYDLFADGVHLGNYILSYEDIPANGRPALFPNNNVSLTSHIEIPYSDSYAQVFDKISKNSQDVKWDAAGTAQIESALTVVPKSFDTRTD